MDLEPPQRIENFAIHQDVFLEFWLYLFFALYLIVTLILFFSLAAQKATNEISDEKKQALIQDSNRFLFLNDSIGFLFSLSLSILFARVFYVLLSASLWVQIFWFKDTWLNFGILFSLIVLTFWLFEFSAQVYASKHDEKLFKRGAIYFWFCYVFPPFAWLRNRLGSRMDFVGQLPKRATVKVASGELAKAIELTIEEDFTKEEHKIFEGIVKFGNTEARQIMRSRVDMVSINVNLGFDDVMSLVREHGYSRVPIFENRQDNVVGVLNIKDLLPFLNEENDFEWQKLVRDPYFIPETKKIDDLLKDFQSMKMHIAIVVDEYGGTSGMVTLEDVLEEILGDISDEFDDDDVIYSKIDDSSYVFEGRTALNDFYKITGVNSEEFEERKGDAETLGGFIVETHGKILKNNEFMMVGSVKLIVESSDKRRVKLIKVEVK